MTTIDSSAFLAVLENPSTAAWRPPTFGMELRVDMSNCNPDALNDVEVYRAWLEELVPAIGMTAFGKPLLVPFGRGSLFGVTGVQLIRKAAKTRLLRWFAATRPFRWITQIRGVAAVQLIETSNINAHGVKALNTLHVNVFSCRPFRPAVAIAVTAKYFGTERSQYHDDVAMRIAPGVTG